LFILDCGKLATGVILPLAGAGLQARERHPVFLLKNKDFSCLSESGAAWQEQKSNLFRSM
jgi:hypothetical protein